MRAPYRLVLALLAVSLIVSLPAAPAYAAKVKIVNADGPGEGFNDPTPAAPVGGNRGRTVGQQRLLAFQYAANIWGSTLPDYGDFQIRVNANFDPLTCTSTTAILGSAGTITVWSDFPGATFAETWYHSALANRLAGYDLLAGPKKDPRYPDLAYINNDIQARFNSRIGTAGCLDGGGWYYGLDTSTPAGKTNLVAVLLHEFAHGLGFANFVNEQTGAEFMGMTDIYSRFTRDNDTGKTWDEMSDAERQASAKNSRDVSWTGAYVTASVPEVLAPGTPLLIVNTPSGIAGNYDVGTAAFGPPLSAPGITGNVVLGLDPSNSAGSSTTDACSPLTNAAAVAGNIALVDRGTCAFTVKVKNAQNAGAIAVIVADNAAGSPPAGLGGADATIVIPSVRITRADGVTIRGSLAGGVSATLGVDLAVRAGADEDGRALLYAPDPVALGSSISHWDTIATPNQLMEPFINPDLTHSVSPPFDLTYPLLKDIGW